MSEQIPERDWREKQKVMDDLMGTVELQRKDLDSLQKDINAKEKLCSALRVSMLTVFFILMDIIGLYLIFGFFFFFSTKKQMTYLESQHNDSQAAREEARRLRVKMKTFERYLVSFCQGCLEGLNATKLIFKVRLKYKSHLC